MGFGPGGVNADAGRFAKVVEHSNSAELPLVVIPGDLVQTRSIWQRRAFIRIKSRIKGQVLITPGNHDVMDVSSLKAFRENFGADYHDFVYKNCAFILINSETAIAPELSRREFEAQWRWLEKISAHHSRAKRNHIFFATHRPPFVNQEDEENNNANWPIETRARLLKLARQHGVRWILSGHLHRTQTAVSHDGIRVVALAGTARSFDQSPIGYGVFEVDSESVRYTFERVAPAPKPPFRVPGIRGWTPRLFDFSLRHWLLTVAYLGAAIAAFSGRRRLLKAKSGDTYSAKLWGAVGALMAFYGVNMQLDFDELLAEIGRALARLTGIYPIRHTVTGIALLFFVPTTVVLLARYFLRSGRDLKSALAIGALLFPTVYFCLCAISNHRIGLLFDEGWWDLLNLGAIITIAVCGLSLRPPTVTNS